MYSSWRHEEGHWSNTTREAYRYNRIKVDLFYLARARGRAHAAAGDQTDTLGRWWWCLLACPPRPRARLCRPASWAPAQLQLQQEQPQAVPHLQVVQSQPPVSPPAISNPPELPLWEAVGMTMAAAPAVASTSGNILHPPQPLPHWQPAPHPQLPPQQDILLCLVTGGRN